MDWRIGVSVTSLIFSVTVLAVNKSGNIFPWAPIALGIILIGLILFSRQWWAGPLAVAGFCLVIFAHSPLLLNMDPDKYAVGISRIIETGSLSAIKTHHDFYASIPAFHIFTSVIGIVSNQPGENAIEVFGGLVPITSGIGTAALAHQSNKNVNKTVAAVLGSVCTAVLYYAVAPIPQLMAVIIWSAFLPVVVLYRQETSTRPMILLVIFLLALTFSHKLGILVPLILIVVLGGASKLTSLTGEDVDRRQVWYLGGIFGIVVFLQMAWLTGFIRAIIVIKLLSFLSPSVAHAPNATYIAAVAPYPGIKGILLRNGDWLVFGTIAGLSFLFVAIVYRRKLAQVDVVLAAAFATGALLPLAFFSPGSAAMLRLMLFAAIPFGALIALAHSEASNQTLKSIVTIFVIIVIISQLGTTGATPDHPAEPREYLTTTEVNAKIWTTHHAIPPVYADMTYAREVVEFHRPNQTYSTGSSVTARGYRMIGKPYLNGNITKQGYNTTLYRPNYGLYQTDGRWRLTYDPELQLNREENRVYDNGGGILFTINHNNKIY